MVVYYNVANSKFVPVVPMTELEQFHFGTIDRIVSKLHHLFHINRLEDTRPKLTFPIPPHRKRLYDLIYLTGGESVRSKGLNSFYFGENQFFFLPPLQITSHEYLSEDATGYFVHFAPELFGENIHLLNPFPFLQFDTHPLVDIPKRYSLVFQNLFERLLVLYDHDLEKHASTIRWYLMAIFSEVNSHGQVKKDEIRDSASSITQRYKIALTRNIYTHRTVKDYASLLHVTPNHLNKCVKKTLNITAQSLLNEMVIMEAKSLLKYSDLTVTQIAHTLHRSSASNFSRFFRQQTGTSPKTYQTG